MQRNEWRQNLKNICSEISDILYRDPIEYEAILVNRYVKTFGRDKLFDSNSKRIVECDTYVHNNFEKLLKSEVEIQLRRAFIKLQLNLNPDDDNDNNLLKITENLINADSLDNKREIFKNFLIEIQWVFKEDWEKVKFESISLSTYLKKYIFDDSRSNLIDVNKKIVDRKLKEIHTINNIFTAFFPIKLFCKSFIVSIFIGLIVGLFLLSKNVVSIYFTKFLPF